MPKEITHWLVAMESARELGGSLAGEAALRHPHALKLGAVFPDVLYYLAGSSDSARYRGMAHAYHGSGGEDTHRLIRRIAAALPGNPRAMPLWAFLAGVACHIQTDTVFHPFIYYLTGDYEDADPGRRSRSVKAHRRLECLVDLFFCKGAAGLKGHSLPEILENLELPLPFLLGIPCGDESAAGELQACISAARRALANFRILQGLSRKRLLAQFLDLLAPVLPAAAQEVIALLYSPSLDAHLPRLAGPLSYRNPVTGAAETVTLPELFDRAVRRSADSCRRIEEAVVSGAPVLPETGAPLSLGVVRDNAREPRYFAETPFFGEG